MVNIIKAFIHSKRNIYMFCKKKKKIPFLKKYRKKTYICSVVKKLTALNINVIRSLMT